jgi:hypothetical protein
MSLPSGDPRVPDLDQNGFVPANVFWRTLLRALGARAITMPWRRVYLLHEHIENPALRHHEQIHIEQITRDGAARFTIRYLWWLIRHGYAANPYEIEAYTRTEIAFPGSIRDLDRWTKRPLRCPESR